jgi:hypothetical protein
MRQSITNFSLLAGLGWGIAALILLVIVGVMTFTGLRQAQFGRITPARVDFLKSHIVGQGALTGPLDLQFPADFYTQKLYLLGEIHGRAAPQIIDLALLKLLHEKSGVRDYLAEIDPIEAAHFNAYLETGDEAYLAPVFDFWRGRVRWGNVDFREKVRQVRLYNQTLPEAGRIRFTGIDEVHNVDLIESWLSPKPAPATCGDIRQCAAEYLTKVEAADAKSVLGGEKTKKEMIFLLTILSKPIEREDVFFKSYAYQVREGALGDRPAYGLWGTNHIVRAAMNGQKAFAELVRESDLPAHDKIASLQTFSVEGALMFGNKEMKGLLADKKRTGRVVNWLEDDGPVTFVPGIGDLKAAAIAGKGVTIFRLDGDASPYREATGLGEFHSVGLKPLRFDAPGPVTTTAFDYAILIRGSQSVEPLP